MKDRIITIVLSAATTVGVRVAVEVEVGVNVSTGVEVGVCVRVSTTVGVAVLVNVVVHECFAFKTYLLSSSDLGSPSIPESVALSESK